YAKPSPLPERFAMLGVPTLWPVTPAEYLSWKDIGDLTRLVESYLDIGASSVGGGTGGGMGGSLSDLEELVDAYGASGHEANVRKVVLNRLDPRLRSKTA